MMRMWSESVSCYDNIKIRSSHQRSCETGSNSFSQKHMNSSRRRVRRCKLATADRSDQSLSARSATPSNCSAIRSQKQLSWQVRLASLELWLLRPLAPDLAAAYGHWFTLLTRMSSRKSGQLLTQNVFPRLRL